jgi:excisionase family DNA binding protein
MIELSSTQDQNRNRFTEMPLLLRAVDVQRLLNVSRSVAYQLMANGQLPTVKIGRSVRVPREGLEEWLRQNVSANAA